MNRARTTARCHGGTSAPLPMRKSGKRTYQRRAALVGWRRNPAAVLLPTRPQSSSTIRPATDGDCMPADTELLLRSDPAESPETRRDESKERWQTRPRGDQSYDEPA